MPGLLDDRYCAMGWPPGEHGRPHDACTGHLRAPTLVSDASRHVDLNGITNSTTRLRMSPSVRADGGREEYCRAASAPRRPRAPVVRVGLPPAIVSGLRSEVSYIVTLVAPTCDHESISCPQMVFTRSGGTPAWEGMTASTWCIQAVDNCERQRNPYAAPASARCGTTVGLTPATPLVISRIDIGMHVIISMPHRHRNCSVGPALPNLLPPVCHQPDLHNCL